MNTGASKSRPLANFILLLFGLSIPLWVIGAAYDVELFPGLKLFQLPLATPAVAALMLSFREGGKDSVAALLKRTCDVRDIRPKTWYFPIFLVYPSISLLDYLIQRMLGASMPSPHFSIVALLGYSTVFFLTFGEELGLTGYAIDRVQQRCSALMSGIVLGLVWAGYHVPGFIISGHYSFEWICWHALYTIAGRVLFVWIYNNSGQSLFAMALLHSTFGVFWTLWPDTGNLQKAPPVYDPRIAALVAISYVAIVTSLWGSTTLARFRFARSSADTDQSARTERQVGPSDD